MSVESFRVSKDNLDQLLTALAKEIRQEYGRKANVELVIVGGAAIIGSYHFRDVTTDIDATMPYDLKATINRVGDKIGLPDGWMNNDFQKTSSYSPYIRLHSKPYKTFMHVLEVRTVKDEYLIAMKARSARIYKRDLSDIIGIVKDMQQQGKRPTMETIQKAFTDLYGKECVMDQNAVQTIKQCMTTDNLDQLYQKYLSWEDGNKEELLAFEERYPHVLNEGNIEQILQVNHEFISDFEDQTNEFETDEISRTNFFGDDWLLESDDYYGKNTREQDMSHSEQDHSDDEYER